MEYLGYDSGSDSVGPTGQTGDVAAATEEPGGWRAAIGWFADRVEEGERQRARQTAADSELQRQQWEIAQGWGSETIQATQESYEESLQTAEDIAAEAGRTAELVAEKARIAAENAAWWASIGLPVGFALGAVILAGTTVAVIGGVVVYTNPQLIAGMALAKAKQ